MGHAAWFKIAEIYRHGEQKEFLPLTGLPSRHSTVYR